MMITNIGNTKIRVNAIAPSRRVRLWLRMAPEDVSVSLHDARGRDWRRVIRSLAGRALRPNGARVPGPFDLGSRHGRDASQRTSGLPAPDLPIGYSPSRREIGHYVCAAGTELASEHRQGEGLGRVVVGVVLTVAVWVGASFFYTLAVTFGPAFMVGIVVATCARRMGWTRRTARVSTAVFVVAVGAQAVTYLHDSGHTWSIFYTVVYGILSVAAMWLAWVGGLIVAWSDR